MEGIHVNFKETFDINTANDEASAKLSLFHALVVRVVDLGPRIPRSYK